MSAMTECCRHACAHENNVMNVYNHMQCACMRTVLGPRHDSVLLCFRAPQQDPQPGGKDTKLQRDEKETEPTTGPTGKGTGHHPPCEAKNEQVPQEAPVAAKPAPPQEQLSNDAPMKDAQSEQENQRDDDSPDKTQQQDHHAEWPESWSGSRAWQSWGGWSDWSWGAGWSKSDWDHEPVPREHLQWRNRSDSLKSWP